VAITSRKALDQLAHENGRRQGGDTIEAALAVVAQRFAKLTGF
jgi:hypothetical protein